MRIVFREESAFEPSAWAAQDNDLRDCIEVPDADWNDFEMVCVAYRTLLKKFREIFLQQQAMDLLELEEARKRVAELETRLNVKSIVAMPATLQSLSQPIDETDAGMGISGREDSSISAASFKDELAELRERTQAKRQRRA